MKIVEKKRGPKPKPREERKTQVYFMVKEKHELAFIDAVKKLLQKKYF